MYYLYYPESVIEVVGKDTFQVFAEENKVQAKSISSIAQIDKEDTNVVVLYPALVSLLSFYIFDKDKRRKIVDAYNNICSEFTKLKSSANISVIFASIHIYQHRTSIPSHNGFFQVDTDFRYDAFNLALSELYVTHNKEPKLANGRLEAISRYSDDVSISGEDLNRIIECIFEASSSNNEIRSAKLSCQTADALSKSSKTIKELDGKYNQAITQLKAIQEQLVSLYDENEELKRTFESRLDDELFALNNENEDLLSRVDILTKENENLLSETGELKNRVSEQEKKIAHTIESLQKVQELYEHKVLELGRSSSDIAFLTKQNENLLSENNSFNNKVSEQEKQIRDTVESLQSVKNLYELTTIELQQSKKELEKNQMIASESEAERKLLLSQLVESKKGALEAIDNLENLSKQVDSDKKVAITRQKVLEREKVKLSSKNAELAHKYSTLRYELFCLNRELEIIQSSPFWLGSKALLSLKSMLNRNKLNESVKADIALIATSEYFDFDWYFETYPDVKDACVDPAQHYLICGAEEGRLPGPKFDGNWYLERYPDVAEAGINPLLHFIKCGRREGRVPSPMLITDKR